MTQPFISICVPVYNGEAYLRECLDSCFSQDYPNFEVLVCDDGSKDASPDLLNEYQVIYPQLRVYKNENNLGLVGNWNRCVELAKGEWIKLVFQDDYLRKDALSEFAKQIKPETQLLVSRRHFVLPADADAEIRTYYSSTVRTLENTCGIKSYYSAEEISKAAMKHIGMNFIAEPSLSLFRKSALHTVGAFQPLLKQICDLEFMLRLASRFGVVYIVEDLCYFRIHKASTTNSNVSSNYFELRFMEPVLFSWLLLYSDGFELLRKHLNSFQKTKLHLYFRLKCYKAAEENERLKAGHKVFNPSFTEFKAIQLAAQGAWYIRLLDWVI
ncbi:MAG: glycosyltransferase [Bacteroidia bacterium]|nr:glycosyltransferase [Bacteroidia bacterium]